METLRTAWTRTRDELRGRPGRRAHQHRLELDRAADTSANNRMHLDATITRAPGAGATQRQRVLARQRAVAWKD